MTEAQALPSGTTDLPKPQAFRRVGADGQSLVAWGGLFSRTLAR
jgi:hypothetical protein